MRLAGKSAIITGAGLGIGRACAIRFAREGASVIAADVVRPEGEKTVRRIREAGGEATFLEIDVARRADNERMVDACLERYGKLDILFCNAGVNLPRLITETSDDAIERVFGVNVYGFMHAARYAIPVMLEQERGGVILVTASKTGLVAQRDSPVYCASKGAAVLFARALALDYAERNIRVNALCPGIIDTPMLRAFADAMPDPEVAFKIYAKSQPMGRLGTADECADAAVWLASDEASFVTGVALPIDGGFTAM